MNNKALLISGFNDNWKHHNVERVVQQVLDHCTEPLEVPHTELGFSILRYETASTYVAAFETKVLSP